jgi:hypothetical protein
VPRQEIGLIDYAYWPAGATGLIGMAFPALTRGVFNGTNATEDNSGVGHERLPSRTIFATMVEDGKIPPIFTVALGRNDSDESYIALGESLPPVNLADQFVRTPMLLVSIYLWEWLLERYDPVDALCRTRTSPQLNTPTIQST